MLSLNKFIDEDDLKFTKSQLTNSLYKYGHITKEQKNYLDKIDALSLIEANKNKSRRVNKFNIRNAVSSKKINNDKFFELNINSQEVAAI